jgi:hypothetical protein
MKSSMDATLKPGAEAGKYDRKIFSSFAAAA